MSDITTLGTLAVNDVLPEPYRKRQHVLDKKGIHNLFQTLAEKDPDKYVDVLRGLSNIGKQAVWTEGVSVSLAALRKSKAKEKVLEPVRARIKALLDDDNLSDADRRSAIVDALVPVVPQLQEAILKESSEQGSPFIPQIESGARGKKSDLVSLRGADLLAMDPNDRFMPIPLLNSYAEGFTPAQYAAASYGQRKGQLAVKLATAEAGFANKKLVNAAHRFVITKDVPDATRLPVGMPTSVSDRDNIGAVLARDAGTYKAGTVLNAKVLEDLKDQDIDDILVHSVMTEPSSDGGISALAGGRRTRQGLHQIGDNIGIPAAQAIGERLSQGSLCLVKGTKVRMGDWSVKNIEDISSGDSVMGADASGKMFPVRVVALYDNGTRSCKRYIYKYPRQRNCSTISVDCTPDHKVLGHSYYSSSVGETHRTGIIPIGSLNKESGPLIPNGFDDSNALVVNDWRATLFGTLLGDGCYTETVHGVYLSCADTEQIEYLNTYLSPRGYRFRQLAHHNGIYYRFTTVEESHGIVTRDGTTGRVVSVKPSTPIVAWLAELGMYGKYAHEKTIPEQWLSTWSNRSIAELIAGLFVTDGSVYTTKKGVMSLSFGSTSEILANQVRDLLFWRFGVISAQVSGTLGKRKRKMYSFAVTEFESVRRFKEAIPLFGVKRDRIEQLFANKSRAREQGLWFRRVDIEDLGEQPTFDIEVDHPDHLFVLANGLVVSNSAKHSSGVKDRVTRAGMEFLNRLIEAPDHFPEAGPLSEDDGVVEAIRDAPQGGKYVSVNKREYYLPDGIEPVVKVGDNLERGDELSDGVPHPKDLVRLRGIGEARQIYLKHFREALENSGAGTHRRNLEAVVAGLLNWARIDSPDGIGEHIYGDIVPFNTLAHSYKPRNGAAENAINLSVGQYLEEPALHYTPGTRITRRVAKDLDKWGIKKAYTHPEPPDFEPEMVRGIQGVYHDPDWKTRLTGFYTGAAFEKALHRGLESDTASTSYAGAMSKPEVLGRSLGSLGKYGSV